MQFDIWEQGNVSPLQLSDKLQGALRHALCDVVMELTVLPNPLCLGVPETRPQREEAKGESQLNSCPDSAQIPDCEKVLSENGDLFVCFF